jgi:hypothetical protein
MKKQEFLIDTADTFRLEIWENSRQVVPTSATITVTKPNTTTEIVSAQAMVVESDGTLTYGLTAGNNDISDENYKAVISYVVSGNTFQAIAYYDIVKSILAPVITDDDILAELPSLTNNGYRVYGTATSGSTTTIVDEELSRYADDYFTGGIAVSLTQDEDREITDFVSSTGTATTTAFPSGVSTDKYMLIRSYQREIDRAFAKLVAKIQQKGRRHALILDSSDLKETHILMTVAEICKGFSMDNEDTWWALWTEYKNDATENFRAMKFKYDIDDNSILTTGEEDRTVRSITTARG